MTCHNADLERVAGHDHRDFGGAEFFLEVFRMAGIAETLVDHRPFVDRGGSFQSTALIW